MKLHRIWFAMSLVSLLFLGSCERDDENSNIPLVNVDVRLFTSSPEFVNLSVVGGWEYLTGGSRGLLVYRLTNDQFIAYDRHCPYQPDDACARVEVDPSTFVAQDPCCGSQFSLIDGSVLQGPAAQPLKMYGTTFDGNQLYIFN